MFQLSWHVSWTVKAWGIIQSENLESKSVIHKIIYEGPKALDHAQTVNDFLKSWNKNINKQSWRKKFQGTTFKNYELCVQAAAKQENSLGENLFLKIITILGG